LRQILLELKVLVGRHENVEAVLGCPLQQLAESRGHDDSVRRAQRARRNRHRALYRAEDAAADALAGDLGKEVLDRIQPGGGGGREVEGPAERRGRRQRDPWPRFPGARLIGPIQVVSSIKY